MKSVGILTLESQTYNYGGLLQEVALQDVIINLGYECEIINYRPINEPNTFSMRRGMRYFSISKVVEKIWQTCWGTKVSDKVLRENRKRKQAFDDFRTQYLHLSRKLNYEDLHAERLPYDAIVCGSDQIWNPSFNIPAFFLDFAKEDQRKIIYAASIGKEQLTKQQLARYAELMVNLDCISVREQSAKEILSPISPKQIEVVLDPTMLHDRSYWSKIAADSKKSYSGYVFCYFLDLTEEKVEAARRYASERNLKIVSIPFLHGRDDYMSEKLGGILDSDTGPADFLWLVQNADCVLTDSFHATVFSLLFQKKFWVFGRQAGRYNMNTRLDTLLKYFHAENRMILPEELSERSDEMVCFSDTDISKIRQESFSFLRAALN